MGRKGYHQAMWQKQRRALLAGGGTRHILIIHRHSFSNTTTTCLDKHPAWDYALCIISFFSCAHPSCAQPSPSSSTFPHLPPHPHPHALITAWCHCDTMKEQAGRKSHLAAGTPAARPAWLAARWRWRNLCCARNAPSFMRAHDAVTHPTCQAHSLTLGSYTKAAHPKFHAATTFHSIPPFCPCIGFGHPPLGHTPPLHLAGCALPSWQHHLPYHPWLLHGTPTAPRTHSRAFAHRAARAVRARAGTRAEKHLTWAVGWARFT